MNFDSLVQNILSVQDALQEQAITLTPTDILHEPVTLEFLGLPSKVTWSESELEEAIINHMEEFLLEMGNGF